VAQAACHADVSVVVPAGTESEHWDV